MTIGPVESGAAKPPRLADAPNAIGGLNPAARHTWRGVRDAIVALSLAVLILSIAARTPPLHETSAASISADVGHETVAAAMERGLPPLHPLILDASVEPGPASAEAALGHRATVTFALLGVPGPTRVKLFADIGGHWGGTPDRRAPELAFWSLLTPTVVLGIPWLLWQGRRRRADRADRAVRPTA